MDGFVTGRDGEERLHPVDMVIESLTSPFAEGFYKQKHALFDKTGKQTRRKRKDIPIKSFLMNKILKAYFSIVNQGQGRIDASLPIWQGVPFLSAVA